MPTRASRRPSASSPSRPSSPSPADSRSPTSRALSPNRNCASGSPPSSRQPPDKLSGPPAADGNADEPEPEDPRFVAAEAALDEGDLSAAEAEFQKILDEEPANAEAQGAIRQVRFLARVQSVDPGAVAAADAAPNDIDAQLQAADVEVYSQAPDAAFARLIGVVARSAGDDKTRVRTRLLELFELFDPAEPVVMTARRKLAAALY